MLNSSESPSQLPPETCEQNHAGARAAKRSIEASWRWALPALAWIALSSAAATAGPVDGFNRASRSVNFWILDYVLEPTARGYNFVVPKWGQAGVRNALQNLERPRDTVQSLLQWKPARSGTHLGAFVVDSTVGVLGLWRPSEVWFNMPVEPPETMSETLGVYGIPQGGYLILPLFGETCPRCLVGAVGDAALHPLSWIQGTAGRIAAGGVRVVGGINLIARQMPKRGSEPEEWRRFEEIFNERPSYDEGKELFRENLQADVDS